MTDLPLDPDAVVALVRDRIGCDGGFTIDMWSGRPVRHGVAVCADRALTLRFDLDDWDDERVADWLRTCRRAAGGARVGLHVGGWHPTGHDQVHLDLVQVLPPARRRAARFLGLVRRQRAVFDLTTGALVPVRAVG